MQHPAARYLDYLYHPLSVFPPSCLFFDPMFLGYGFISCEKVWNLLRCLGRYSMLLRLRSVEIAQTAAMDLRCDVHFSLSEVYDVDPQQVRGFQTLCFYSTRSRFLVGLEVFPPSVVTLSYTTIPM